MLILLKVFYIVPDLLKENNSMSNYVCNECTSEDIKIIKGTSEMDCYCNNCKKETYTVSLWWTNQIIKGG